MNLGTLLPRHARYRPDHLAVVFEDWRLSFRQFNARVNRLANALLGAGLAKGDKLATVLPNCLELLDVYWAAAKTGIVVVPMSPLLQTAGLAALLRNSDAVMVIAAGAFADTLERIRGDLPAIGADRWVLTDARRPGFRTYAELTAGAPEAEPPDAGLTDADPYNIIYSSGTTGEPKGIVHTHYVRAGYCAHFASAWRMTPESVVLHAGALVFNGAFLDLMPWMFLGCTYILHPAFDAGRMLAEVARSRVTHMVLVPSQIVALLAHPAFAPERLASLEMLQSVGAPLHLEHKRKLNELLPGRFYELYGLTEGFMTVLDRADAVRKAGSVGVPLPFYEMRILDEAGRDVPPGTVGEICGRGPLMMTGYYKRPDLTAKAIVDGWLHSGDLGRVDEDGFLFLVDRKKDMIISGGVNVYPRDIEEVAVQHPAVREAAVFGVPDPRWGETPVAAVVLAAPGAAAPAELAEWINARVGAKYQRVSDVLVCDDFPRNVAGKTLKRVLQEQYAARRGAAR
ncbi:MAG: AMP-dependent synthetase [Candidatus Rokubacteria bacterium RIFCSPHIGHO2_12_FULL_73_22]|nr:MAG: AMP-dependent synthetase [Candidatus Rokubacteria bacterium RIFCSPHIGHO2_02_FULL_73_26]OGL00691.1 MAG: AMP-dependent synthetase [Candidatus Rokubacteria bacterium RIFCSPHIGHO2_12_FULL_73_22]OGL10493.1 MAG: AMP-dependent synthetase [Candidatus Rokubacteria bacterium RIFCSPLOWO2_02_FULL_73_56]OGL30205.1 MAG: AMP-dependent synthetase [Candidatus Rokubacteria bacterium RIFCSPLOWO2_12_FULL_73_47]